MDTQKNDYDINDEKTGYSQDGNRGWFGNDKVTEHYNSNDESKGFTREETRGFFGGDNVKVHYDKNDNETGYSREESRGWFGNDNVTVHYDKNDNETGYTRKEDTTSFFGSSQSQDVHYNSDDSKTGTTIEEDKGNCFLTTACTQMMGLDDSCYELQVLRKYRDNYLTNRVGGIDDISKYYSEAPEIVNKINKLSESKRIWQDVFNEIQNIVSMIESNKNEEAYKKYTKLFNLLKKY
ncbi:MAG: CFI-box-CTERM domain-containing protein [Patescibacteria group bacterium]